MLSILIFVMASICEGSDERMITFYTASDASAAIAISKDFAIIADDENNILRMYNLTGGQPVYSYDLTKFLQVEQEHPESDIEGAALVNKRIYWITSHGRNTDGKLRPNRYRFFATDFEINDLNVTVKPAGKFYDKLVHAMLTDDNLQGLGLYEAAMIGAKLTKKDLKKLAPKEDGLNIEALCASADNNTLYIGLRNPRPVDRATGRPRALVIPLKNADDIVDKEALPVFGKPILWDLAGLGIRSMEFSPFHKSYFIIAGSSKESGPFALYRWSGDINDAPRLVKDLNLDDFSPESLVPFTDSSKLLLISDDGTLPVTIADPNECYPGELNANGTCPNKFLFDSSKKTFRALWLDIP